MIADLPNWKCLGSHERRLMKGKAVVSVIYGTGILGGREIEVWPERDVRLPLPVKVNRENVRVRQSCVGDFSSRGPFSAGSCEMIKPRA